MLISVVKISKFILWPLHVNKDQKIFISFSVFYIFEAIVYLLVLIYIKTVSKTISTSNHKKVYIKIIVIGTILVNLFLDIKRTPFYLSN